MHTFTTDLTAQQVQQLISEIAGALGLSTSPLNDHGYQQREGMTVLAEISPDRHRSGGMRAWIVGYQDITRTTARVVVFPHEWASFDIGGTQAIYDAFVRLISERLTPVQADQPVAVTPQPALIDETPTEQPRGMKLGTAARVNEFHRLMKLGYSHRYAKEHAHCDPSTYYRWCREVTGEDPREPYR